MQFRKEISEYESTEDAQSVYEKLSCQFSGKDLRICLNKIL